MHVCPICQWPLNSLQELKVHMEVKHMSQWEQYRLKKGMSEHDKAKVMYKMYLEKVPVIQIAKEFGITREAVYQKFRSFGMPLKPKKKVLR